MTQIYLAISAGVVLFIGVVTFIILKIRIKKLRSKMLHKQQEESDAELRKLRNDLGTLPFTLKDFFNSKAQDYDVESFINTIYKNSYKNILCCYENDNFVLAAIQEKCKLPIFFDENSFDIEKWNDANDKLKNEIHYTPVLFENNNLDLLIYKGKELSNIQVFDKYYPLLNVNGMMIINQQSQTSYDLKLIIKKLQNENIRYEVSYVKSKFLYIVKA